MWLALTGCDDKGRTPLLLAAQAGHRDATLELLSQGAALAALDNQGEGAMTLAREGSKAAPRQGGHESVLDLLLRRGRPMRLLQRRRPPKEEELAAVAIEGGEKEKALRDICLKEKKRGNEAYKSGNYEMAIEAYTAAIDRAGVQCLDLVSDCLGNRGLMHLQLKDWEKVIEDTTQVDIVVACTQAKCHPLKHIIMVGLADQTRDT